MTLQPPVASNNANVFMFTWEDLNVQAMVERIEENGHQTLVGEVTIRNKAPGVDELLEQTRLNLSSQQSRNQLAKALTERSPDIDWVSVIKYISVLTINKYREGEPTTPIGFEPEDSVLQYCLRPILEKGEATTIFAPGGSGKSYLADYIGVLVQYGVDGVYGWDPEPGNVLLLDWESAEPLHNRRVWAIKAGMGLTTKRPTFDFNYRFCTQALAHDIVEIQRQVLGLDISLVIVDSQVAAGDGDVEKADAANRYYNALRSLRCTTLTLDHVPKNTEVGKPMPFGSVFKWNRSRSQYELRKTQEPDEHGIEIGMYHRKCNEGRLQKARGITIEFHEGENERLEQVIFRSCDVAANPELSTGLHLVDQITSVLRSGAMAVHDIAIETNTTDAVVRTTLHRHKQRFVSAGRQTDPLGKEVEHWGLLSHAD